MSVARMGDVAHELHTTARGVVEYLGSHPLTQRFAQKIFASGDSCVYTAADVLGERMLRLCWIVGTACDAPERLQINVSGEDKLGAALRFGRAALQATPYLWTEKVRGAIKDATPIRDGRPSLPRHTVSSLILPEPSMWWTFEAAIGLEDFAADGRETNLDLMLVRDSADGLEVFLCGERINAEGGPPHGFVHGGVFPYGCVFPDDYANDPNFPSLEAVLGFLAFLNSPFIPKRKERLTRSERREISRRLPDEDPAGEVTFVSLRRAETRSLRSDIEKDVIWRHQWIVAGHYRAQWYPGEGAHHVIWIAPHLKGPSDAPLLEHAYRVVR